MKEKISPCGRNDRGFAMRSYLRNRSLAASLTRDDRVAGD